MSYNEWLAKLKPGDEVIVLSHYGEIETVRKVERVTPTQLIVFGWKFRKSDGFKAGNKAPWNAFRLLEPTPERVARARIRQMISELKAVHWETIDQPTLERMYAALRDSPGAPGR